MRRKDEEINTLSNDKGDEKIRNLGIMAEGGKNNEVC